MKPSATKTVPFTKHVRKISTSALLKKRKEKKKKKRKEKKKKKKKQKQKKTVLFINKRGSKSV